MRVAYFSRTLLPFVAFLLSGCLPLKVEKELWKANNEKWEYRLTSRGPRFGEGWDVLLTVTAKTSSTVFFRRRILQNADTDIPEGFKRAA